MNGQWIELATPEGESFEGYLSLPPTGTGPGIVLIQEIFGVNEHIRTVADQYALDGYVVLAPDLFWRMKPRVNLGYDEAGFKEGFGLMTCLDIDLAIKDITVGAKMYVDKLMGKPTPEYFERLKLSGDGMPEKAFK